MPPMQEPMLSSVLKRLDAAKGAWPVVAKDSGVPYQTLMKIACRIHHDPRVSTVQALYDYFERQAPLTEAVESPDTTH